MSSFDAGPRRAEALYFYAVASRDLGDPATYLRTVRRIVDEFPTETWAEEALNTLASYYLKQDDDDAADAVFRELYQKYPERARTPSARPGRSAGARIVRNATTKRSRYFERAAVDFPRSDYRPVVAVLGRPRARAAEAMATARPSATPWWSPTT